MVSDDIVTELRADQVLWKEDLGINFTIMGQASDEIERLRAEVDRWKHLAIVDHLHVCNVAEHELCLSYLEWKVNKMVSSE